MYLWYLVLDVTRQMQTLWGESERYSITIVIGVTVTRLLCAYCEILVVQNSFMVVIQPVSGHGTA